jgi:two-component system, sensor histidine kinase FlrB
LVATAFDAEALQSAFARFNRHSGRLEASWRELKAKVTALTRELQAERSARHGELLDKERLGDRLVGMLEALPAAVIVIDGAGIIRERNSRAMELLNRPLLGCPWSDVVRREFCAGRSANGELKLRDGRWLSLARRKLPNEPGEILLLSDVTESRRMAELMHRHQRLSSIGEMTASLAHQIRTPLTCALLLASQLEKKNAEERQIAAQKITARLQDLAGMVDDMLRFAGGVRQLGDTIPVAGLFQEVMDDVLPRLQGSVRVTSEVPELELSVTGNRGALKGALMNLVENALQACGEDGRVELSAWKSLDSAWLAVIDNGHGIGEETRARLFEPFFPTRPQGTGLGLAVVRSVAEAHDGQVLCHSGPGGTVFAMRIPERRAVTYVENRLPATTGSGRAKAAYRTPEPSASEPSYV